MTDLRWFVVVGERCDLGHPAEHDAPAVPHVGNPHLRTVEHGDEQRRAADLRGDSDGKLNFFA